jgi:hypothetical protein
MPWIKQAVMVSDNMHWCSDDSGMRGLVRLAQYLEKVGRDDLIRTSAMMVLEEKPFDRIYEVSEISEKNLHIPDIGNSKAWKQVYMNFSVWRLKGGEYKPAYGWRDFQ